MSACGIRSILAALLIPAATGALMAEQARPNVLIAVADDWGLHAGAYGTPWVKTPAFDRVAREGLLFKNAYTPMAKCGPSRSIILTGRHLWQLEEAGNHLAVFPQKFKGWKHLAVFPQKFKGWPETLMGRSWHVGYTGKGWGPGVAKDDQGKPRNLTGLPFQNHRAEAPTKGITANDYAANFSDFLEAAPPGSPWCFWYGSLEPHRDYEFRSGHTKGGKKISDVDRVPGFWPDHETVRHDMLDYAYEVEHTDRHLGRMLDELERRGLLENTVVIVTSDHGMPFPRVKGHTYEHSNHVPLAIRWPKGIPKAGRVIEDFVDFTDIAPTILDFAGIAAEDSGMMPVTGKSWTPILSGSASGQVMKERDHVLLGKERTDVGRPGTVGYPVRGLIAEGFLFLHNYEAARWPSGNPETGYLDTDGSPTKSLILELGRAYRTDRHWLLNFGKRPADELFELSTDPDCLRNLASEPGHTARMARLRQRMETELKAQGDPRMSGQGHVFDRYKPTAGDGFFEAQQRGEKVDAGWVNPGDFEKDPVAMPDGS